jgi:hypothetical protein
LPDERPRTDIDRNAKGVEVEQPGEKEKIKQVSDQFNRFQMMSEYTVQRIVSNEPD